MGTRDQLREDDDLAAEHLATHDRRNRSKDPVEVIDLESDEEDSDTLVGEENDGYVQMEDQGDVWRQQLEEAAAQQPEDNGEQE